MRVILGADPILHKDDVCMDLFCIRLKCLWEWLEGKHQQHCLQDLSDTSGIKVEWHTVGKRVSFGDSTTSEIVVDKYFGLLRPAQVFPNHWERSQFKFTCQDWLDMHEYYMGSRTVHGFPYNPFKEMSRELELQPNHIANCGSGSDCMRSYNLYVEMNSVSSISDYHEPLFLCELLLDMSPKEYMQMLNIPNHYQIQQNSNIWGRVWNSILGST